MGEEKGRTGFDWIPFLVGIPISFFGYRVLQVEPITHWFENLINPIVQICGIASLLIGVSFLIFPIIELLSPVFARFGFGFDNSSPAKPSFDPSTGMFYFPADQDITEVPGSSEE